MFCLDSGRPSAQEGRSSTVFNNSQIVASSYLELGPYIPEISRRREREMKRDSLNTSILLPHFQSRDGMLNHIGGIYPLNGIMDYPRNPNTEVQLGKFLDSMEFQSWKVNFRTEVCMRTSDPQITMHWIQEVDIAKSIVDLLTSRSIVGRTDFFGFEMLDAMFASALKKLPNTQIYLRKRVSVEEQRAQKSDRFFRGRQICEHDL